MRIWSWRTCTHADPWELGDNSLSLNFFFFLINEKPLQNVSAGNYIQGFLANFLTLRL